MDAFYKMLTKNYLRKHSLFHIHKRYIKFLNWSCVKLFTKIRNIISYFSITTNDKNMIVCFNDLWSHDVNIIQSTTHRDDLVTPNFIPTKFIQSLPLPSIPWLNIAQESTNFRIGSSLLLYPVPFLRYPLQDLGLSTASQ